MAVGQHLVAGWTELGTGLLLLGFCAVVYWSAARCLRSAWHRANAEAMAECVADTTEQDALRGQLAALEERLGQLAALAGALTRDEEGTER